MPDCFISYSTTDEHLAYFVQSELHSHDVTVFMASASLQPGQHWSAEILNNLRNSNWVIVLASRAACKSAFVNQEIGGALLNNKCVIPIVWDMPPTDLPGWARGLQAIDLQNPINDLQMRIAEVATRIKQEKAKGLLIVGSLVLGLLFFGSSD